MATARKLNFVFVGLQRIFTDRESTATSIAKELAKDHNVLYVNPPIDRRSYLFGSSDEFVNAHIARIRQKVKTLEKAQDNLWVLYPQRIIASINWFPNTTVFSFFNKVNNRRFAKEIKAAVDRLGFGEFIVVNDKDIFRSYYLKELLNPRKYIYLDRDYIVAMDYWKRHGSKLEPKLMQKSDMVLCNSYGFQQRALKFNASSYYIGNGCDIDRFNPNIPLERPDDLHLISGKPVIGYVGALLEIRLDIELLVYLAASKPQWNFVLVGQEDQAFESSKLHELDNIYFLGKKDAKLAPAYIKYFDVCINPQLINAITNDNYPLKIDEYLAMGKPVVATATNVMKEVFSSVVYLAEDKGNFLECIEEALLAAKDKELQAKRVELARSHSWSAITEKILEKISV